MANPEHVEILKQGAEAWNTWQDKNPAIIPDLTGYNFSNFLLRGHKLHNFCFNKANFSKSAMEDVFFINCNFFMCNLSGVRMTICSFMNSILSRTNLSQSELTSVFFTLTTLNDVKFDFTCFSYCYITLSSLNNLDLSKASGLETIDISGPLSIGIDTIFRSGNKVSKEFYQRAGVSMSLIEYLPNLIAAQTPIQRHSCFISHSSQDAAFAQRLHRDLRGRDVPCWFAPEDLKIGDRFSLAIHEAIGLHDKLLLVLTEHSVGSPWVTREVERARALELQDGRPRLFPIRLDDAVKSCPAYWAEELRQNVHIGDFRNWQDDAAYQQAFDRLLRDLAKESTPRQES